VQGHAPAPGDLVRFLQIRAQLDYSELEPGRRATEAIRKAAADLDLGSKYQARVRLTGPVPMADEEFSTIKENAALNATVTIAIVLLILWLALRWLRIILAVFICIAIGLAITAAVGMLLVGTLNLISVYFAVLFVGLGVDFGIQFSVRYRAERYELDNLREALLQTGRRAGAPLTLAALATAAGFLSFLPTVYKGVSELGLIAGIGMLIAFASSITLLPALLSVFKPPSEAEQLGYAALAPVDRFLERHRMAILIVTAVVVVAGLPLLYWLRFDFNPINLRSPKTEAVSTYLSLKNDPDAGTNDIQVLEPSLQAADQVAAKLRALPEVSRVLTLSSFIPADQQQKLPLIQNAAKALLPLLNPAAPSPPPTDAQNVSMMGSTVDALKRLGGDGNSGGAVAARRLAAAMTALAKADPAVRARVQDVVVQPLRIALDDLRNLLTAREVTRANLPPELVQEWLTPDGKARIDVAPSGDSSNNEVLQKFARAVQAIAPEATEGPISILEARREVVIAFIEAGACALLSIGILLWITLRRFGDVLLTLLQSVLTRAVTFSACTTATAFGSLWFSSHPGTSSMGKLLAISLLTTMAAAALFQPVLMGKPREIEPSD
jgi:hopanoid biosynthesis associated RND transporter like protein HpnN